MRIFLGDAIVGEDEKLQKRALSFFDNLAAHLKQEFREIRLRGEVELASEPEVIAEFVLSYIEGRMRRNATSRAARFSQKDWERQWQLLQQAMFIN
jgi:TetR/AcrR family transcriptional regulator